MTKTLRLFFSAFFIILLACTQAVTDDSYLVTKILDGDTVQFSGGERVRYIGIDTPEKGEPFSEEAKELNQKLVLGKRIKIEFDVQERDKYGRLLGYVYVDNIFVNAELIKAGLAVLYTYPPNVKHSDYFAKLQKQARDKKAGIWSEEVELEDYYLAVKGSKRFHRPDCNSIRDTKPGKLLEFKSREEALDKGFSPCRRCKP
jgi:micrococcal nuclease